MDNDRYYISIQGVEIPVSKAVYQEYTRAQWREEKQEQKRKREHSLEWLSEHGAEAAATSGQQLIDDIVADKLLLELLFNALETLTAEERRLIDRIYFDEETEATVSKELGVSQVAVHKRKHKILKKLKKLLQK